MKTISGYRRDAEASHSYAIAREAVAMLLADLSLGQVEVQSLVYVSDEKRTTIRALCQGYRIEIEGPA